MRLNSPIHLLFSVMLGLLLSGCVGNPPKPTPNPQAERAARLFAQQDYAKAAHVYLELARSTADATQRQTYLVLATDSLLYDGQFDKAKEVFRRIVPTQLDPKIQFRYRLVQSELALQQNQPQAALQYLAQWPNDLERRQRLRLHRLRAQAYEALQAPILALKEWIQVDRALLNDEQHLHAQLRILQALQKLDDQSLMTQFNDNSLNKGWAELALLLKSFPNDPMSIIAPFSEWRDLYPQHPVVPELLSQYYAQRPRAESWKIERIAVLLPFSNAYGQAANTLREGILSAWYQDTDETRPIIQFYDSSNPDKLWPLLNQVAEEGADIVIGPLSKPAILQLARADSLPIPVLALNQVDTDVRPPTQLYQYALSPEDEARQVALWAYAQGWRQAAVLYPENKLGQRARDAFIQQWQMLDSLPVRARAYAPDTHNLSAVIAHLVDAQARKAQIQATPEQTQAPAPSKPLGPDFIFAIGNRMQIRQIRPLLQFHYAGDLPVLTLPRVWNGQLSQQEAFDLNGIALPEMPWIIDKRPRDPLAKNHVLSLLPSPPGTLLRLLPMGMDAYQVIKALPHLEQRPDATHEGHTGELYLDEQRKLLRRLTWIRLDRPPRILGTTPRPDELMGLHTSTPFGTP